MKYKPPNKALAEAIRDLVGAEELLFNSDKRKVEFVTPCDIEHLSTFSRSGCNSDPSCPHYVECERKNKIRTALNILLDLGY